MTCKDNNIKELLTGFAERILDQADKQRVEEHLAACEDCRSEVFILRMMIADTVPDPGEVFWKEMPSRVNRAVQEDKATIRSFDLSWLVGRITLPRWVLAAATVGVALVITLTTVRFLKPESNLPLSQGYIFSGESMAVESINVAELSRDQIVTINTWAGSELASMAQEAEPVIASGRDTDIYEELAALNANEIDSLSHIINNWEEEG